MPSIPETSARTASSFRFTNSQIKSKFFFTSSTPILYLFMKQVSQMRRSTGILAELLALGPKVLNKMDDNFAARLGTQHSCTQQVLIKTLSFEHRVL